MLVVAAIRRTLTRPRVLIVPLPHQTVNRRNRWWMIGPATIGMGGLVTAFWEEPRRGSLIFVALTSQIPWLVWGILSAVVLFAAVLCAWTSAWVAYFVANVGGWVLTVSMFFSAVWARWVRDAQGVPSLVLALIGFAAFVFLFVLWVPVYTTRQELVPLLEGETRPDGDIRPETPGT